jgi:hypothetical protein
MRTNRRAYVVNAEIQNQPSLLIGDGGWLSPLTATSRMQTLADVLRLGGNLVSQNENIKLTAP